MKKRLITGLIFVLTIALSFVLKFYVSNYFFDGLILAVACIGGYEVSKLFSKMGKFNDRIMAVMFPFFAMIAMLVCIYFDASLGIAYTIAILVGVMVVFFLFTFIINLLSKNTITFEIKNSQMPITRSKYCLVKSFNTVFTFIYPTFMLMFLTFINHFEDMSNSFGVMENFCGRLSLFVLLLTLLVPIITDTFAYLTGGMFGGKKLAPKISPNKTISGAVGGVVWAVAFTIVVFCIFNAIPQYSTIFATAGITLWKIAIIAFIGSIVGQCGDLFESFLKRQAGVKDSGKLLPGHGGILDRFDSHIAVALIFFVSFAIIFLVA